MKIRSNPSFKNVPVIFLSAESDRESILKGFELGAQDYITKPFDARELLSRVKTHLNLKGSLEKLENQNSFLEAKVADRTRQLKEANDQLNHLNIKLLDLDMAKAEFLRLISHEIRTPLNGIIGPMELLKESDASRELGDLLEILDLSVKRLEKFSLNALLITQLKTKQVDIRMEPVFLGGAINELLEEKAELFLLHGLSFTFKNESMNTRIKGNIELIKLCIENILDNALAFVPNNGAVEIHVSDEGDNLVCQISDNGPGFSSGIHGDFSEVFSLGDQKKNSSLGIGLPICRLILEAHSGDILLGNNPEGGAYVKLVFKRTSNGS